MIELRWMVTHATAGPQGEAVAQKTLQYRYIKETTTPSKINPAVAHTTQQWSDWETVPEVRE